MRAGTPATSIPSGTTKSSFTTAPAATMASGPTTGPSRTTAFIPISDRPRRAAVDHRLMADVTSSPIIDRSPPASRG